MKQGAKSFQIQTLRHCKSHKYIVLKTNWNSVKLPWWNWNLWMVGKKTKQFDRVTIIVVTVTEWLTLIAGISAVVTAASFVSLTAWVALGEAGIISSDSAPVTLKTFKIFTAKQKNTIVFSKQIR